MHTTIDKPTLKRAVTEIATTFTAARMAKLAVLSLVIFALVAGITYGNTTVIPGLMAALVCFICEFVWFGWGIKQFKYLRDWLWHGIDRSTAKQTHFPKEDYYSNISHGPWPAYDILEAFGLPALVFFLSSFLFVTGTYERSIFRYGIWVSGERTSMTSGWITAAPFVQPISLVPLKPAVQFFAVATTKDNVKVQGLVTAYILLANEMRLITIAKQNRNPALVIDAGVERILTDGFKSAIAERNLSELQSTLTIEYKTGNSVTPQTIAAYAVKWNGILQIESLHPYFRSQ